MGWLLDVVCCLLQVFVASVVCMCVVGVAFCMIGACWLLLVLVSFVYCLMLVVAGMCLVAVRCL